MSAAQHLTRCETWAQPHHLFQSYGAEIQPEVLVMSQ